MNRLAWRGDEFVVIMTHQFERDRELLHLLRDKKLSYLGILGPRRRTSRLLAAAVSLRGFGHRWVCRSVPRDRRRSPSASWPI